LRCGLEAEIVDESSVDTACKWEATVKLVVANGDLCFLSEYSVYNFGVVAFVFEDSLYLENLLVYGWCFYNVRAFYYDWPVYEYRTFNYHWLWYVSFWADAVSLAVSIDWCAVPSSVSNRNSTEGDVEVYGDAGACFCFGGESQHCGQDEEESEELFHNF
jgi:hypothetical protein